MPFPNLADLLNASSSQRIRPEQKDIWKIILGIITLFGIVVLYVLEFDDFTRTFDIESLLGRSALWGAIIGAGIAYFLTQSVRDVVERIKIYLLLMVTLAIIFVLFGSMTNRLCSFYPIRQENIEFVEFKPFAYSRFGLTKDDIKKGIQPSGYFLFFIRDTHIERTFLKKPLFQQTHRGDTISVSIQKGLWGYDVIYFPKY